MNIESFSGKWREVSCTWDNVTESVRQKKRITSGVRFSGRHASYQPYTVRVHWADRSRGASG